MLVMRKENVRACKSYVLELDTFQVVRGQGQISDINKDGHVSQLWIPFVFLCVF